MPRCRTGLATCLVLALPLAAAAGAAKELPEPRTIPVGTVVMALPASAGALTRPAVELDHTAHTTALTREGCATCHVIDGDGFHPGYAPVRGIHGREALADAFHDACFACHRLRRQAGEKAGPVVCGSCHVRRPPGRPARAEMQLDYSLHARHAQAFPEKCELCHHVLDKATKKLVHVRGAEEACRSCHGAEDAGRTLSLENAAHRQCVTCHLKRRDAAQSGGPVHCVGCHDSVQQQAIARLEIVPRLLRGQPDTLWVKAGGGRMRLVPFDHLGHEPRADRCSSCHHATLKPCIECHTLRGSEEGGRVTLAEAHHHPTSIPGCIGCHRLQTRAKACSGCHALLTRSSGTRSCLVCHGGSFPADTPVQTPPSRVARPTPAALPATSDAYPEKVVIASLARAFQASEMPHARIVARLDSRVRESGLAVAFHGSTETLCAGCHHHTPIGTRPPPCRSCHGDTADPVQDRPDLKVAYHRQCIGCHQEMAIARQGCTDCHAAREVHP